MIERNYTAFISYRHKTPDMEIAKHLHTAIETYRLSRAIRERTGRTKTGLVFRDQDELPLSSDLGRDIETALDRSEWFIAVCSPRYLQSRWCMRELEYFIEHKGIDHVLTILIEGEPEDSFPAILQSRINAEGKVSVSEPLAADVRGKNLSESLRKLRNEKLRILAPILSVAYDDLRLREKRRRKKRLAVIAASIVLLGCVIGGILYRNARLREEAILQQRLAEEERLRAVSNSIGENLQAASSLDAGQDKQSAAALLLDTLKLSEENDGMRRDEIISQLRRTMYIEPFSVVSKLDIQNERLNNAAVSPDGTQAICAANGNTVALIDLGTGRIVNTVSAGNSEISSIAFSPDGTRFLAVYGDYRYATVWNTLDGSEVFTYSTRHGRDSMLANVLFWKDADTLLIQDYDQLFLVSIPGGEETLFYTIGDQQEGYNYESNLYTAGMGKPMGEIITDSSDDFAHTYLLVSPDRSRVVVTGKDGTTGTIVLDDKGERVALLDRLPGTVAEYYDISPDGKYVSCQSYLGFMGVWETETGRMRYLHSLSRSFTGNITPPVFSPDSSKLAYISESTLIIENLPGGKEAGRLELAPTEFPPRISWSEDGSFLFFFNPNLYFVDAEDARVILMRESGMDDPFNNAVPAGGSMVFVTRGGGEAVCYSLPGGSSMAFRDDFDGELCHYDPLSGSSAWETAPEGEHTVPGTYQTVLGMQDGPSYTVYSPDGQYAALVYPDGPIEVFRREDPSSVFLLNAQFATEATACGITGDILCAADSKGRVLFQNITDGTMTILDTGAAHLTFNFDLRQGLLMASQEDGKRIDVFSVKGAELLFTMSSSSPFLRMGFSEDGEYAVAFTEDACMAAHLYTDEALLLEEAEKLAPRR